VSLEVIAHIPGSNENCIKQFMHFHVPCLGVIEDLTDVVHQTMDNTDHPWGGLVHLPSWAQALRAHGSRDPKMPQRSRRGGFEVVGTRVGLWVLGPNGVIGPGLALRG
jgi:hypothetical protein